MGLEVVAVSRNPRPAWFPEFTGVQWVSDVRDLGADTAGVDMLLSAGPIQLAARWAGQLERLERAVVVSTSSVLSKAESPNAGERAQIASIQAVESELAQWAADSGAALCVLRPTLVYGCGLDRNVSLLARWIERFGLVPLSRSADGLRQPIHAADLAALAVALLTRAQPCSMVTPVCGSETLTYREMVARIFHALDKPVRVIGLPEPLLIAIARLGGYLGGGRVNAEMIRRQAADLVFDDGAAWSGLGFSARGFHPRREDFSLPEKSLLIEMSRSPGME
jgi:uncharacterized protein YbjT (DUF2867 family)